MSDKIPFVDLRSQYARHKEQIDAAIADVVANTAFIGGPAVAKFEADFAEFCGAKHAVGVGNGTDALALIFKAMGLGPNDEVIIPTHTFIASAEAATMANARVVFVDVDEHASLIDPQSVEAAITANTKAILAVHLYGQLAPMAELAKVAERHGVALIEDAAQAHGASVSGKRAGSLAKAAGFSFYPGKNLGAYGDGGAVTTHDDALADRVRRLANHGRAEKYTHDLEGVNSRLDGIQAAVLGVKLQHLDDWTRARRAAAKRYQSLLEGIPDLVLPRVLSEEGHAFHLYVVRVPDREGLRTFLGERGVACGVHYPIPLHLQPAYAHLGHTKGAFPNAEKFCDEIISLPMFAEITEAQQENVAAAVGEFMRGGA